MPTSNQLVSSSDLLVAEFDCKGCTHLGQYHYNPTLSSTASLIYCSNPDFTCKECDPKTNQCRFNNTYQTCDLAHPDASCSNAGPAYIDYLTIAPNVSVLVGFGAIDAIAGAPDNQGMHMPGVLGLAFLSDHDMWRSSTVFQALLDHGAIAENLFSMCILNSVGPDSQHRHSGELDLGFVDTTKFTGQIYWTPTHSAANRTNATHNVPHPHSLTLFGWYVVDIVDVRVDGHSLGLQPNDYGLAGGAIIDSGTNTFVVSKAGYDIIFSLFLEKCKTTNLRGVCDVPNLNETIFTYGVCVAMSAEDIAEFPVIQVVVPFALDVENDRYAKYSAPREKDWPHFSINATGFDYLLPHPERSGHYCIGIQPADYFVLGNVNQAPYYIIYDREHLRLGFAEIAECAGQQPRIAINY